MKTYDSLMICIINLVYFGKRSKNFQHKYGNVFIYMSDVELDAVIVIIVYLDGKIEDFKELDYQ
jgi:hypothetical protein